MDTKFKSRAPTPSMFYGYPNVKDRPVWKTKKQSQAEESQYKQDMLANHHYLKKEDIISRSAEQYPCFDAIEKGLNSWGLIHTPHHANDDLAQKIIDRMPGDTVPIHISINGSRAKGYNMDDSPYSIKVISMASRNDYALGHEKRTYGMRFSCSFDAIETS